MAGQDGEPVERWIPLVILVGAGLGGALCWLIPEAGPWPLLIALLPWMVVLSGICRGHRIRLRRTPLNIPLVLFLLTALMGAWVSYNRIEAAAKLWVLLAAVLFYLALSIQPRANLPWVYALLSAAAAAISLYFLFTFDLERTPPDLAIIARLAAGWTALRPRLGLPPPQANVAGGLIAMLFPLLLALLQDAWRKRRTGRILLVLAAGGVAGAGLFISSSRAAWLALAAGMGAWLLWEVSCRLAGGNSKRQGWVFAILVITGLGVAAFLVANVSGGRLVGFLNRLPGQESAFSRLEIWRQSLRLGRDFVFTGGGLHAFSGLFAHYIKVEPHFLFSYSHDLYLDLLLEQGLGGLVSYLAILGVTAWMLLGGRRGRGQRGPLIASLVVMLVHGLVDDPLYANRGTPLLLLLPGLVMMATQRRAQPARASGRSRVLSGAALVSIFLLLILAFVYRDALLLSWYANLGAVQMARVELTGFPSGTYQDGSQAPALAPAEALFQKAQAIDAQNVTANHRLGLIAMLGRDYPLAQGYLERAYTADPGHRGVRKSLAYTYVWLGEYERAVRLLQDIPEAVNEMETYAWWWGTQGRPDLAEKANAMLSQP
jgi:O-antigen ligase